LTWKKQEWKPFRAALGKKERKEFDDMWDIPRLYITACSNSVQLVPLHPIMISILFHHYKELTELMAQFEQMEARVREGKEDAAAPTNNGTLDRYIMINNRINESQ
jgi:hypothetical protein